MSKASDKAGQNTPDVNVPGFGPFKFNPKEDAKQAAKKSPLGLMQVKTFSDLQCSFTHNSSQVATLPYFGCCYTCLAFFLNNSQRVSCLESATATGVLFGLHNHVAGIGYCFRCVDHAAMLLRRQHNCNPSHMSGASKHVEA